MNPFILIPSALVYLVGYVALTTLAISPRSRFADLMWRRKALYVLLVLTTLSAFAAFLVSAQ